MPVKLVFGGAGWPNGNSLDSANRSKTLEILLKNDVTTFDTARLYNGSEAAFGTHDARTKFTVDTKLLGGFVPGNAGKDAVLRDTADSLQRLKVDQVDILYIHAPDDTAPLSETLAGIDEAYKKGSFRRFGLSNFTPAQVREVYDLAREKGWVLPSVYQGNYSPIARHLETILFPTLRELGMAFYAYSPLAGGFLTKTPADLDAGVGRFKEGSRYSAMYDKPEMRAALGEWDAIANEEGVSKAELAYRWVGFHSVLKEELGDAVIFGVSRPEQIEQTVEGYRRGPLSQGAADRIEAVWQSVKEVAPVDNFGANKV